MKSKRGSFFSYTSISGSGTAVKIDLCGIFAATAKKVAQHIGNSSKFKTKDSQQKLVYEAFEFRL